MWSKAIEETIAMHKEALAKDMSYIEYKLEQRLFCPLCKEAIKINSYHNAVKPQKLINACKFCLYEKYLGRLCDERDYGESHEAIARLEAWKKLELSDEAKTEGG